MLEIINVATPDANIFLCIAASVAYSAAVNPNSTKTLLANGLSTVFIKGNQFFSNGPKSLPKDPRDRTLPCSWVFDNFVLGDEPFAKALRILETCVLVNDSSCRKLFSSWESPTTFDSNLKVILVPFFIADLNL